MPTIRAIPTVTAALTEYWKIKNQNNGLTSRGIIVGKQPIQVVLSAADIIAMNATPVNIKAAPSVSGLTGSNLIWLPTKATLQVVGTTAFTGGGVISIVYAGTAVTTLTTASATILTAGANSLTLLQENDTTTALTTGYGLALNITNASAAFAAGTGTTMIVTVFADILNIG